MGGKTETAIARALLLGTALAVTTVSPVQAADPYVLGECQIATWGEGAGVRPTYDGDSYLVNYRSGDPRYKDFGFVSKDTKVTLVKAPKHGKLVIEEDQWTEKSDHHYRYWPNNGYAGKDRFTMLVEKDGVKVRIEYLIEAGEDLDPLRSGRDLCVPEQWKISDTSIPPAADSLAMLLTLTLARRGRPWP